MANLGYPTKSLGELITKPIRNGYSPKEADEKTDWKVLTLSAISGGRVICDSSKTAPNIDEVRRCELRNGDFLITRSNTPAKVGESAMFRGEIERCSYPDLMMRFRVDHPEIDREFLNLVLGSFNTKRHIRSRAAGTSSSMVKIGKRVVETIPIPMPPLGIQQRISELISNWDRAISVAVQLLDNSIKQKRGLAQQLLTGKRRLPSFQEEWKQVHLGDIFVERTEIDRLDLPLLSITSGRGVIPQSEVGRKDSSTEDKRKYKRIAPGDIGYNSMRMWQGVSALSTLEGIVSPAYTIVTPRKGIDAKFMSYLFKLPRTVHDFRRYSQGLTSDTWNLKYKQFREVSVCVPDFDEQQAIATAFAMQDEVISMLEANKAKLELEKRALMQQLLTGKRRVKLPPGDTTPAKEHAL